MANHDVVERLRRAALDLASSAPGTELTVAAIAEAAGITRDDYYRHAPGPMQLLAEALSDELLTRYDDLEGRYTDVVARSMRPRIALTHIAKWADVYRGPLRKELMRALQETLAPSFRMINEHDIRNHPEILPEGLSPIDDLAITFVSAYIAGGGMAAIEVWVEDPEPDVERGLQLLMAVSPLVKIDLERVDTAGVAS
jgi:AcrR family transcriptional regulator